MGLYAFAYWPARLVLWTLGDRTAQVGLLLGIAVPIGIVDVVGRRRAEKWLVQSDSEPSDEMSSLTVIDLGGIVQRAPLSS